MQNQYKLATLVKYILEGIAITACIFILSNRKLKVRDACILALSISASFLLLDMYSPGTASGARQGTGFGLGFQNTGLFSFMKGGNLDESIDEELINSNIGMEGRERMGMKMNGPVSKLEDDNMNVEVGSNASECVNSDLGSNDENKSVVSCTNIEDNMKKVGQSIEEDSVIFNETKSVHEYEDTQKNIDNPHALINDFSNSLPCNRKLVPNPAYNEDNRGIVCYKNTRWEQFDENPGYLQNPVNQNTNEYKLVPGLYSKYVLRPGYNEPMDTYNNGYYDKMMCPPTWGTLNPVNKKFEHLMDSNVNCNEHLC